VIDAREPIIERLATFAGRPLALATMAAWAAAEAIVLPVVPDVGLGLLALAAPRHAWRLLAAVVGGAVLGSVVLALLAVQSPDPVRAMLLGIPGIDAAVLADARADLAGGGIVGFAQVGPGVPLKVYTAEWVGLGGDLGGVVAGAVLNRLTRVGPAVVVAVVLGWFFGPWIRRHSAITLGVYAAFWIVMYAAILA